MIQAPSYSLDTRNILPIRLDDYRFAKFILPLLVTKTQGTFPGQDVAGIIFPVTVFPQVITSPVTSTMVNMQENKKPDELKDP